MANDDVIECCRCFLPIHRDDAKDYLGDRVAHRHERCIGLLSEALRASRARVAELERGREILVKIHAAWTYPGGGSIGALLDEVAEHIEPGVFIAAMAGEDGRAKGGE